MPRLTTEQLKGLLEGLKNLPGEHFVNLPVPTLESLVTELLELRDALATRGDAEPPALSGRSEELS